MHSNWSSFKITFFSQISQFYALSELIRRVLEFCISQCRTSQEYFMSATQIHTYKTLKKAKTHQISLFSTIKRVSMPLCNTQDTLNNRIIRTTVPLHKLSTIDDDFIQCNLQMTIKQAEAINIREKTISRDTRIEVMSII